MKEGMTATVLKIPGVRWARWATCIENPHVSTVFAGAYSGGDLLVIRLASGRGVTADVYGGADWDSVESQRNWEATPEAQAFVNFWSEKTEPPLDTPNLPGIYHRHISAPSDVLDAIFSKPIVETHEFFIPSHFDLETTRKSFAPFNERINSELFVPKGIPWVPRPTLEDERNIVTLKGWDSVGFHRETTNLQWVKDGLQQTFGGMERVKSVHWKIQPSS
jgi:hypothetical protein